MTEPTNSTERSGPSVLPVTSPLQRPITRELWTAEHAGYRAIAVKCCRGCPVMVLCGQAAAERDERWGVWGGIDRSTRPEAYAIPQRRS